MNNLVMLCDFLIYEHINWLESIKEPMRIADSRIISMNLGRRTGKTTYLKNKVENTNNSVLLVPTDRMLDRSCLHMKTVYDFISYENRGVKLDCIFVDEPDLIEPANMRQFIFKLNRMTNLPPTFFVFMLGSLYYG